MNLTKIGKFFADNLKLVKSLIILLVALTLISSNFLPVYAASYDVIDYRDYAVWQESVDGVSTFMVQFPAKMTFMQWSTWLANGGTEVLYAKDNESTAKLYYHHFYTDVYPIEFDTKYADTDSYLVVRPLGYNILDLTYIPSGTVLEIDVGMYADFDVVDLSKFGIMNANFFLQYFDKNGEAISNKALPDSIYGEIDSTSNYYRWRIDATLDIPAGAVAVMPRIAYSIHTHGIADKQDYIYVNCESFKMILNVSDLFILQKESGKTNSLLEGIQEQNQTIINGTPEQNAAADKFESDTNDAVSDMEQISNDMAAVTTPEVNIQELVPNDVLMGTHFLTYVDALNNFWDCEEIVVIMTILASLVLIGVILHGKKGW